MAGLLVLQGTRRGEHRPVRATRDEKRGDEIGVVQQTRDAWTRRCVVRGEEESTMSRSMEVDLIVSQRKVRREKRGEIVCSDQAAPEPIHCTNSERVEAGGTWYGPQA